LQQTINYDSFNARAILKFHQKVAFQFDGFFCSFEKSCSFAIKGLIERKIVTRWLNSIWSKGTVEFPWNKTFFQILSNYQNFDFPNCQNFPFQTVKISFSKLSKFPFPNYWDVASNKAQIDTPQPNCKSNFTR
jgi:hypothetical protein